MSSSRGTSAVRVVQKKLQKIVQEFISSDRVVALVQGVKRDPETEILFSGEGVAEYADNLIALEADVNAALKFCSRVRGKKQEAASLQEEFRATLNEAFDGIFDFEEASLKPTSNKRGRDPDDVEAVAPPKRSASRRNSEPTVPVGGLSSEEKTKLKEIVGKVMKNPAAEVFLYPVDSKMYPEYYEIVETPMDLTTIKQNINTYESVADALEDMRLIWKNCFTFNLEGSDISKTALSLGTDFEKLVEAKFGKGFVDTKWKKFFRKPPAIAVDSQNLVPVAPDSAKRPNAEKKKASKAGGGGGYADVSLLNIADVKQIVQELVDNPRAELFLEPVDPKFAPGYHDMITTPMDLGTIHKKLRGNKYFDYVNQVINDVRLVWRNCETYNDPDSEIVGTVGELSDYFESRLASVSNARKQELKAAQKKQAQAAATSKPSTHKSQVSASSNVIIASEPDDNFKNYVAKALYKSLSVNALKDLINVINTFEEIGPFLHPVSDEDAPGYSHIISKPMAVKTIERKFALGSYHHKPADFVDDVRLIWSNCMKYNLPESEFYQMAEDNRRLFEESLLVAIRKDEEQYYDANPPDYKAPEEGGDGEGDEQDGDEGEMEEDDDEDDVNANVADGKRNAEMSVVYEKQPKQKITMYTYDENGRKKRVYCTFRVRKYRHVLRLVMAHELAAPFATLQANAAYFEAVEQPLDLITIRDRAQEYQDMPLGFLADLKLVFDNWLSFSDPTSQIYQAARAVKCYAVDCYFQNFLSMISFKTAEDEECIREHKLNSRNPLPASGDPFASAARKETAQAAPKAAGTQHQSLFPTFSHKKLVDLENKLQLLTTGDERVQSRALRESARATAAQVLKETKVLPFVVAPTLYEVYDFGVIDPRADVEAHCEDAIFPNKFTVMRAFRIAVVPASKPQITAKEVKQYPYVPFTLRGMIQAGPTVNDKAQFIVSLENRTIVTQTRNSRESWVQVFDNLEGILNCLGGKLRRCRAVLNRVCISPDCQDFLEQVSSEFVDYYKNISSPMWFREIYNRLNEGTYDNEFDFAWDMRLVFRNCKMYNAPNSTLYKSADRLSILFEQLFVSWVVNIQDKSVTDLAKGEWEQWYDLRYFDSPEDKQAQYRCKLTGQVAAESDLVQCSSCEDQYLPTSVGLEGTKLKQKWFCSRCTRALELSAQNLGGDPYANDPKEADSVYNAIDLGGNCFVPAPDVGAGWCQARKKNRSGGLKSMFLSPLGYELEKKELIPLQKEFEEAVDKDLLSARAKEFQETLPGYKASGGRRGSKRRSTAKGRRDASKQQQAPQPSLSSASANAIADEQQDNNEDDNNVDSSSSILHPIDSKVLEKNRMLAGNMFGFQAPPGFRLALCGPENEEIIIDKHRQGQDVSKLLEAFVPIDPATVPSHGYFGFHISDIRLRVEGLDKSVDCAKYEFLMGGKMKDQYVEDIKSELQRLHAFSQGEKNIKAVLLHERWIFEKTKAFPTPPQRSEAMDLDDQLTNVKDGFRRLFPQKHFDGLEIVLSLWDFLDSCQSVGFTHFSLADLVSCIQQPANMTQYVSQVIFDEIGCICTDLLFQDLKWRRIFSPFNEQRWQDLCMIYPINVMTWTKVLERVLFIFAMPLSVLEAESLLTQPLQEETVMVLKVLSLLYNHPLIDAFVATSTIGEGDEALVIAKEALNDLRKAVFDALVVKPKESGPAVEGEGKDDDAMQVDDEDAVDETAPAPIATAESVAESLLQIFTNASSTSTSSTAVPAKCIAQWLKALCARLGLFPVDSANEEDAVDPEEEGYHAVNRTWGSFTFANAAFNSLDVIMPYHFMIKPPTAYEAKMTLLTSFERVLTLLHSSDSDDWNASDRLAVFSVIHDNCVVVNEFQRDVKEREQYLTRFETLEGTTGLDALTAETLAQGYSFIPEDSVCHFTGVPFTVLPDSEKWTVVPLAYRQSEVAPTATAVTITSSSTNNAMDVDGDKNEVCTIAPYLRQDPGTSDIVYALKDALNRVINCRKFVKREREQYEGYMETIVNNNFPRAPKLKLLSSMFLRSKPVGYDAEGNVYWLLNVQSKMTLFPFDSSRHAIDPTDSQTLEPCILLRDLTGTWYYHDARNMPKLIRDLNNPVACERLLRYRLAEKLTITSYALRDSTLLIKGYQTPWLDRKLNIERWLTDQQLYVGPNEMHRCRQLEALLGRAMEIRMHIYYAYLFKYDDEVERSSERAEKEAVLRKQRKYKEDCLEEIFDLHPRRGWNRLDLFTRFRQLSATCTATRIVSDPVIGKVITGNVLSKALFLQRNAIDPAEVAADAEGDDDLPPPPPPPSSSAVPSSVVGHQQQPVASSSSSVSATNVAAVVKQEERTPTKEEENTAMEVDEPSSAPPVILKEAESTVAETKQQTTNTKDKMQQVDQIESSFRETTSNNNPPNTADEERHELGIIHRNVPNYEQNGSWPQKSTRAVEQLHSETNEVLRIYPSGRHVSMFLDVSQSGISQCLNNIKPDCYGFKWRWYAGPSLDFEAIEAQQTPLHVIKHMMVNRGNKSGYNLKALSTSFGNTAFLASLSAGATAVTSTRSSGRTSTGGLSRPSIGSVVSAVGVAHQQPAVDSSRHSFPSTFKNNPSTVHVVPSTKATTAKLVKLKSELLNIFYCFPEKSLKWPALDAEGEAAVEKSGEEAKEQTRSTLLIQQPNLSEEEILKFIEKNERKATRRLRRKLSFESFMTGVQNAVTPQELMTFVITLESAVPLELTFKHEKQALGNGANTLTSANVALRLFVLDRSISYDSIGNVENAPLTLAVKPRMHFAPRCHAHCLCLRYMGHIGKCQVTGNLFSRLPDHFTLAPPSDPFSSQRGNSIAYTTSTSSLPLSHQQQLVANEISKRSSGTNYSSTYRGLESYGTAHLTLAELMEKTNVDIETVQGYIPSQVEVVSFHWL